MFNVAFSGSESFKATFTPQEEMTAEFGEYVEVPIADYYSGDYEITPTEQTQLIDCGGLVSLRDFVINPIPSNYGRITWDGSVLTVQ